MGDDKRKPVKPIWMPLYIAEFIADTTNLTASQGWAYINLLCAIWRSKDGTLPHDADTLARVGKVHRPRWAKAWAAIKHLFDVDGDRVTSTTLQAELGKANAIIVSRRAAGSLGGQTTKFNRSMKRIHRNTRSAPNSLINNASGAAIATANYNHNLERREEGEASPSPCNSRASASLKKEEASRVVPSETQSTTPQSPEPTEGRPPQEVIDAQ